MSLELIRRASSRNNVNQDDDSTLGSTNENFADLRDTVLFDSTISLYRSSQFELYYLGMIQDINLGYTQRDPDIQLIDRVEEAQLEGKIQLFPKEDDLVKITISKHGIKVIDLARKEVVLQHHPLHAVAQIVYYNDSFFKSNLAIKIGQVGRTVYDCYIFQCYNEDQAQTVCQSLKEVFDSITLHPR